MLKVRFNILFIILFTFCAGILSAQKVTIPQYDFINTRADTLVCYGNSNIEFKNFAQKFKSMIVYGNRQINIWHLGDSHLQADFLSGQTRKDFQTFFSGLEGTRGMIAPYIKGCPDSYSLKFSPTWQYSNILSSKDCQNLSLWGVTAYTVALNATIELNANNKNPVKYDFNTIRIYHSPIKGNGKLVLNGINCAYQKNYYPDKGYTEFHTADYTSKVTISFSQSSNTPFYIYGFYCYNDDAGVIYNVSGINGASAQHYLNANKLNFHLRSLNQDLIIISLGTNDMYEGDVSQQFAQNLTALIKTIRDANKGVPIILTTPTEFFWHKKQINPRMQKTVETIKQVAESNSCIYFDLYQTMGGKGSAIKMQRHSLIQSDKIHLTTKGYQLAGDLLFNAIWQEIEKYL